MTTFKTVSEMDQEGHCPDAICVVNKGYQVGHLARGALTDALAYGRSLGLEIDDFKGSVNLIERRGHLRARGPWRDVREFLLVLERLEELA